MCWTLDSTSPRIIGNASRHGREPAAAVPRRPRDRAAEAVPFCDHDLQSQTEMHLAMAISAER
jgi:hypothetical protein